MTSTKYMNIRCKHTDGSGHDVSLALEEHNLYKLPDTEFAVSYECDQFGKVLVVIGAEDKNVKLLKKIFSDEYKVINIKVTDGTLSVLDAIVSSKNIRQSRINSDIKDLLNSCGFTDFDINSIQYLVSSFSKTKTFFDINVLEYLVSLHILKFNMTIEEIKDAVSSANNSPVIFARLILGRDIESYQQSAQEFDNDNPPIRLGDSISIKNVPLSPREIADGLYDCAQTDVVRIAEQIGTSTYIERAILKAQSYPNKQYETIVAQLRKIARDVMLKAFEKSYENGVKVFFEFTKRNIFDKPNCFVSSIEENGTENKHEYAAPKALVEDLIRIINDGEFKLSNLNFLENITILTKKQQLIELINSIGQGVESEEHIVDIFKAINRRIDWDYIANEDRKIIEKAIEQVLRSRIGNIPVSDLSELFPFETQLNRL